MKSIFPTSLKLSPHPLIYDIGLLLLLLTLFILPLYLAIPSILTSTYNFLCTISKAFGFIVLSSIGLFLLGAVIVLVESIGRKLGILSEKEKEKGKGKGREVGSITIGNKKVVELDIKQKKEEGIGENPQVKKVWRDLRSKGSKGVEIEMKEL